MASEQKWYEPYISCWGLEEPSQFARALARTIPPGVTKMLDIGCGSGVIGVCSLIEKKTQSVTFSDLEPKWIEITRCNVDIKIRAGAIKRSQVKFLEACDLNNIGPDEAARHDLLAFNPPQLASSYVDEATRLKIESNPTERSFRLAGPDGLDKARIFFTWYASLRTPRPNAVILLSSFLGRSRINQAIADCGLRQKEQPKETRATLRDCFREKATEFSHSAAEMEDRSIELDRGVWYKKLLTIQLANT